MGVNGIYGLSGSGLDIESMVKVGMMSKQNEYDKMYKKQTKLSWQKEAYVDVYNSINNFNNSKLTDYKLQSKMNAMSASTNNSTAFTVSANGSAAPMSHKVEVKELSSNAYLMSTKGISRNLNAKKDSLLMSDSMFRKMTDNGDGTYTIEDWNWNTKTVNASDAAFSMTLNDGQSKATDDAHTITMSYADLAGGKTFNDLASQINKLGLNVTAAYDSVNDSFSLYNKNGGSENNIAIKAKNSDTANFLNNLNLGVSKNGELTPLSNATAPEAITGGTTDHTGTTIVASLLGINSIGPTRNATYVNSNEVTTVSDASLPADTARYNRTYGNGDFLVKTSTVDKYIIDGKKVSEVADASLASGVKRYSRDDGEGDILVQTSTNASGDTVYKTANVAAGSSDVDWSSVSATSSNPVAATDPENFYQTANVKAGTSEIDWDRINSTTTNPVEQVGTGYVIDGKYVGSKVEDAALAAQGIDRYNYTRADGGTADILVKTSTDGGNPVYQMAFAEEGTSNVDWNTISKSSTNPVSNKDVMTTEAKTVIGDDIVNRTEAADANGVATYETLEGDKIYVKAEDVTDAEGKTVTKYKTIRDNDTAKADLDWSSVAESEDNPVSSAGYITVDGEYKKPNDPALSFTLNNGKSDAVDITFSYSQLYGLTVDDVVKKINESGTGLQASFKDGQFSISSNNVGEGYQNKLTVNNDMTAQFFNSLGLTSAAAGETISTTEGTGKSFNANTESVFAGSNGKIVVDGREYTNITDNRATIGGVTYTLLDTTETAATVTVSQDVDSIVDRVKQFVEDYNTMLQDLQDKYTQTKYSDYDVLTKSQEEAMTKEQVEKWNEKAKSGLLNHDSYLGKIISQMREALSTPVEGINGAYNSAFNIGISTITDQGKIELDEDKLKKALAAEPDCVYQIFGKMGDYDSNTKTSDFSTSGVAQRLSDVYTTNLKTLKTHAGVSSAIDDASDVGNKIKDWQDKMSDFKIKMRAFEDMLYKKYDAMESALQKLAMTMNYVSFNQQ